MWMWQLTEGTIYLMGVGVKVAMLKVADVDVYIAQGVKLTHETQFTAEWNAALLAWPTVPVAGG